MISLENLALQARIPRRTLRNLIVKLNITVTTDAHHGSKNPLFSWKDAQRVYELSETYRQTHSPRGKRS